MDPDSVVDSFKARGQDSSFQNRERVYYYNYGRGEKYKGTPSQNTRMNNDLKNGQLHFGYYGEKWLV